MGAVWHLLSKEIILEWRQRHSIGGMFLYVLATVFLAFSMIKNIAPQVWIALYWIIILFAAANATTRSFYQESGNRQLFYYQLSHSLSFIFSKLIYNFLLLILICVITWLGFSFFSKPVIKNYPLFGLCILLGSAAFSTIYTFVSSIAGKTPNGAAMMAILSFPLLIPVLLTLLKLSAQAGNLINDTGYWKDVLILVSIDGLLIGIIIFLFPFVWRD